MTNDVREFAIQAASSPVFGRVLWSARNHHFVADGPVQNGCPGEAVTPPELFLSGVATCGVELVHVIARNDGVPLRSVKVHISATLDRSRQERKDLTLLNSVRLRFELGGVDEDQGRRLIEGFKGR